MKDVEIIVFEEEEYGSNWPSTNVCEFANWIQKIIEQIPEAYKNSVMINIASNYGRDRDDMIFASIKIFYFCAKIDETRERERWVIHKEVKK